MEALLEAMRFREELDLQERQRRRLMKAKTKVPSFYYHHCCVFTLPAVASHYRTYIRDSAVRKACINMRSE